MPTKEQAKEEEDWCAVALEFTAPDTYNVERARGWVFGIYVYSAIPNPNRIGIRNATARFAIAIRFIYNRAS